MDDDEDESQRPRGSIRRVLNYFGLFLLFLSLSFIFEPVMFAPLFLNYFGEGAFPAFYFWTVVNFFILAFSIILLIVNNVFRFFEKRRADRSPSQPTPNWLINRKVVTITLVLYFVPIIIALLLD